MLSEVVDCTAARSHSFNYFIQNNADDSGHVDSSLSQPAVFFRVRMRVREGEEACVYIRDGWLGAGLQDYVDGTVAINYIHVA